MKIVHLGYQHITKDIRILYKECVTLAKAGHNVFYFTSDRGGTEHFIYQKVKIATIPDSGNPYRVIQLMKYLNKKRKIEKKYLQMIEKIKPDIVHIHEYFLYRVFLKLKKKGYKVIYDIHEDNPGEQYNRMLEKYGNLTAKLVKYYITYKEGKLIKKANYVITVTEYLKKKINRLNLNCEIVYNYPILEKEEKK